jgi:hypothetical protein
MTAGGKTRGVGLILLVIVVGLVVGSLLGELLGSVLPAGWAQEVIARGPIIGLTTPATLDLRFLSLTFGLALKVNLVGLIGVVIAALTLRKL